MVLLCIYIYFITLFIYLNGNRAQKLCTIYLIIKIETIHNNWSCTFVQLDRSLPWRVPVVSVVGRRLSMHAATEAVRRIFTGAMEFEMRNTTSINKCVSQFLILLQTASFGKYLSILCVFSQLKNEGRFWRQEDMLFTNWFYVLHLCDYWERLGCVRRRVPGPWWAGLRGHGNIPGIQRGVCGSPFFFS